MTRILVIDDDEQFRSMLCARLAREGYEVSEAADGLEGMEVLDAIPCNLVITDIVMPEKEGLETISEIRKRAPEVRVIAISGGGRMGPECYLPIAKKLGAEHTFAKPFEWEEFRRVVAELSRAA